MLGLRGSPFSKRSPGPPASPPTTDSNLNNIPLDITANPPDLRDTSPIMNGHNEKIVKTEMLPKGPSLDIAKRPNGVRSESHSENFSKTYSETQTTRRSETRTTSTSNIQSQTRINFSKDQQINVLRESVAFTRGRFIAEFDYVDSHFIERMTLVDFLEHIEVERLTQMPHRGSRWDKVLKWAEFFAIQMSGYEDAVRSFVPDSRDAAKLIWVACRVLLDLGPGNASALETTFGLFYKLGLSLSSFLRHGDLLHADHHIRKEVGQVFNSLLLLVRDVSIYYQSRISDISSQEVRLDLNSIFSRQIEDFYRSKNHVIDAMWEYSLGEDVSIGIRAIRKWLGPRDSTLQTILDDRLAAKAHRDEYTCEWFQRHLLDFSRGDQKVFEITGPEGCGKSVLSGWILERLQRPLGKKTHQTLSYTIEADIPSETSPLAVAKNLNLQLLQNNVGDAEFFEILSKAQSMSNKSRNSSQLEDLLWHALDLGLKHVAKNDNLMIVIDGLDKGVVKGGQNSIHSIRTKLHRIALNNHRVKTVILSQDIEVKTEGTPKTEEGPIRKLKISPDDTHHDINHMIGHTLRGYIHFKDQNEHEREVIVEKISHASQGSFLWVELTTYFLKQETSYENFTKAVNTVKEKPRSLKDMIGKLVNTLDFSKSDTKLLLSLLLVAERPLTISEVKCLLEIDLERGKSVERHTEIKEDIARACNSLVVVRNDIVRFRHSAIRSYLVNMQLSTDQKDLKLLSQDQAQTTFTTIILAYCKFYLTKVYEPSFERVDMVDVDNIFHKYSLLQYAVRNWTVHFRKAFIHKEKDSLQLSPQLKSVFPNSTRFAMLEWTCWESQTSSFEAIEMHELALRIRRDIFTEKHESVLQTLITCGVLHRQLSNVIGASTCFYKATQIGESILRKYSTITTTCATTYLTVTESVTVTSRTEIVTHKEEMLKYIIVASKHQYGKTSDTVIRYYKQLAQLYIDIHEEHHAEEMWRELHEIIVVRYGEESEEAKTLSGKITVVIKKGEKRGEVIEYEKGIFETSMDMDVWDIRRIKITLEIAVSCEAREEYFEAEKLYLLLWGRLTDQCHSHHQHGVSIHISMIEIALEYVRFLRRRGRHEEACSILICIWTEYEEYTFESETLFLRLKVIGELMRAVSLLSIAVSVFRKCLGWFSLHGMHEHVASCEILISETVQQITTTTMTTTTTSSTKSTSTTTLSTTSQTVVKEMFESIMSRSTVTTETIFVCRSMISSYMKLEQWSLAIEVIERSLTLIWKMVISGGGTCALPRDFSSEAIDIAINLAVCHYRSYHFHEAEEIYVRVYHACRNSCHIHDERLTRSHTILVAFYEEHRHWHKIISIYQDLLVEYRKHLGASHDITIKTLYILGSLCFQHGYGHAHEYYEEIVTVLNGNKNVCHRGATEAMIILCRTYYEEGHWHKLKAICEVLWETWTHHHHEHKFEIDFIEALYIRYRYVLEYHFHCEYEVLRSITLVYRDTCIKVFGASVSITMKALMEFAEICMRSEKYTHEAIATYEEILSKTTTSTKTTTTTTTITTKRITTVKERLMTAYINVCTHGSVTSTIIERAIKIIVERFSYLKITFGCASLETLTVLRELVLLYTKLKTQEAQTTILRILVETTIEIVTKEKHSRTLYEAAKMIGGIYISCNMADYGHAMLQEMRRQIITGTATQGHKFGFTLDKSVSRVSYVFLVTFEEIIRGSMSISYSQIMSDILTESILYESYTRSVKSGASVEVILVSGGRLHAFLYSHEYHEQCQTLERETFDIFKRKWGSCFKLQSENVLLSFHVGLLRQIGKDDRDIPIGDAACISGNHEVERLLNDKKAQEAYQIARCTFDFVKHHRSYHALRNVGHGFKLSTLMAGRSLGRSWGPNEPNLHEQMLELSRDLIHEVLEACIRSNINFVKLPFRELNDLVSLLGEQKNYNRLEWILNILWSSREAQKTWTKEIIIAVGRCLVQALYLGSTQIKDSKASKEKMSKAIHLCEDICYNLRRVWGSLDPKTLEMSSLLSQIYTEAGHYRKTMGLHEEILRLVVEGDDDDDRTIDTMEPKAARENLDWLKASYQRLHGWDKSENVYKVLVDRLLSMPELKAAAEFKDAQAIDKWDKKGDPGKMGKFVPPIEWKFVSSAHLTEKGGVKAPAASSRPNTIQHRVSSNWGRTLVHRFLHSGHEEHLHEMPSTPKGHLGNGDSMKNGVSVGS